METLMDYSRADEWILGEKGFDSQYLGKCESIMCLGNGYMCIRSATEEAYLNEKRNFFVAGTFNKFDENEVTELPNVADLIRMDMKINGEVFTLEKGKILEYDRFLNIKTGELSRHIHWISPKGVEVKLSFYRFVSMADLHLVGQKIVIEPISGEVDIQILPGIDGSLTNSGAQHFSEGDKRFYDGQFMQYCATTTETKIDFVLTSSLSFDENAHQLHNLIQMDRRKILNEYTFSVEQNKSCTIEKFGNVFTSRDKELEGIDIKKIQKIGLDHLRSQMRKGYQQLLKESQDTWDQILWSHSPIQIKSSNPFDQLAIRFAQYHLYVMTPRHDHRMNIGAKGMSGEGYKGHTFWDTDIFALPYFSFTNPKIARSLEEYRYLSLAGAHQKAKENQYEGAQFPWESAWLDDGEVTPVWGAADIVTGLPTKIWSGFIEQHITADVAYGVWQYYQVTNDQDFMDRYGYELLMDTAIFWASRLEYSTKDQKYHINDVIGPDEYKEHVDDNAFTNYMAHWNIKIAIEYYEILQKQKPQIFETLNSKLNLEKNYQIWKERLDLIFLPKPREHDLIVAQDAHYLSHEIIDLTKYKKAAEVGTMFKDYNLEQVNKIQVSKQADIMILFLLMEDLFSIEVKKANWNYYEPKTLHDSSLSLSTHVILASDMKDKDLAYELFQRAIRIDAGEHMKSSDHGIHAASIAGIWQSIVYGFSGLRMLNGQLRICPALPNNWESLDYYFYWHGQRIHVVVDHSQLSLENETNTKVIELEILGQNYQLSQSLNVKYAEI